jgi:hypothetical protein
VGCDIQGLKVVDQRTKPCGADSEWILAHSYYEDVARATTQARLKALGAGLLDNPHPLQLSLLRRIIDRLAVVYDSPPTRWLVDELGARKDEESVEHDAMERVLDRVQYDLAWRRVDRLRALMRQVVVRYYPSDDKKSVVMRIFEPYNVIRDPSPGAPDMLDADRRFALRLSGNDLQNGADEVWEYWDRTSAGGWQMAWVNAGGDAIAGQPFASTSLRNPYTELPVQMIYDDYNGGVPWFAPRCSRTSWVDALNAISNDLWALVLHEAHTTKIIKTDNPEMVPRTTAINATYVLPKDSDAMNLASNAKLQEAQNILDNFVRLWTLSEDLPASEFDKAKQVVTGATLRVQNGPLLARRVAQVPLAIADEAIAYRKLRAVHNIHVASPGGAKWGLPLLDETTSLEIEVADVDIPTDLKEVQEAGARSLALGTKSLIDLIMAEQNCSRAAAIKIYERVKLDNDSYPARIAAASTSGPRLSNVPNGPEANIPNGPAQLAGKASVVDAIATAAPSSGPSYSS